MTLLGISEGLKRGTIEIMILSLLICQELEKKSKGLFILQEGSLYPSLYRMLEKGYISDKKEQVGKRRVRVYYHIEPRGIDYFEEIKKEYFSLNRGILFALGFGDLEDFINGSN